MRQQRFGEGDTIRPFFFNVTVVAGYWTDYRKMEDKRKGDQLDQMMNKFSLICLVFVLIPENRCNNKLWVRVFKFTLVNPFKNIP